AKMNWAMTDLHAPFATARDTIEASSNIAAGTPFDNALTYREQIEQPWDSTQGGFIDLHYYDRAWLGA
ncbi:MAG: hypothetical protein ACRYGK_01850, partial [Janthinobacterium lividum]